MDLEEYMAAYEDRDMSLLVGAQDMYHLFRKIKVPQDSEQFRRKIVEHAKRILDSVKMGAIHKEHETCKTCFPMEEWAAMQTDVREESDSYTSMQTFEATDLQDPNGEDAWKYKIPEHVWRLYKGF